MIKAARRIFQLSKKACGLLRREGFKGFWRKVAFLSRLSTRSSYRRLLAENRLTEQDRVELARRIGEMPFRPLISVLVPVYNVEEKWLRRCLDSVLNQVYPHWELCLADDASTAPHVRRVLQEYSAADRRIRSFTGKNGHIAAASNSALGLAGGEYIALLDHDDEITRTPSTRWRGC